MDLTVTFWPDRLFSLWKGDNRKTKTECNEEDHTNVQYLLRLHNKLSTLYTVYSMVPKIRYSYIIKCVPSVHYQAHPSWASQQCTIYSRVFVVPARSRRKGRNRKRDEEVKQKVDSAMITIRRRCCDHQLAVDGTVQRMRFIDLFICQTKTINYFQRNKCNEWETTTHRRWWWRKKRHNAI